MIACWTGRERVEIFHNTDKIWLQISPGTESYYKRVPDDLHKQGRCIPEKITDQSQYVTYTKYWQVYGNNEISGKNNKLKNIIALNSWAESISIRVLNFDSFDPVKKIRTQEDPVAELRPKTIGRYTWPCDISFTDYAKEKNFSSTEMGHYHYDAHHSYAKLALESLNG